MTGESAAGAPARGSGGPLGRRAVLLAVVVAAAGALVAGLLPWAHGTASDPLLGRSTVAGAGTRLAPPGSAAALAALAAAGAALLAGRRVRRLLGIVVTACGLAVAAAAGRVLADPVAALSGGGAAGDAAPTATGVGGVTGPVGPVVDVVLTPWPGVALAAGLLLAAAGAAMAVTAGRWAGPTARYERPGDGGAGTLPRAASSTRGATVETAWDRLSAGEDPTAGS